MNIERLKYILFLLLPITCFAGEQLILGVHPYKSPSILIDKFQPLAKYLSKKLSIPVEIVISKDYETHIDLIRKNRFDIAYLGPASYVKLTERFGKKNILARQRVKGKASFKGVIIVRQDSNIKSLVGLKEKSFAFGDASSTMSHLVPRYMLIKAGVLVKELKQYRFYGSHDNVALAVLTGDTDAGAVKEAVYNKYKNRGLRALKFTPDISEHLFISTSKMNNKLADDVRGLFLNMNSNNNVEKLIFNSIKPGIDGFVTAKDSDYENLRDILKTVNK
jgi:phosphonate transport system substrate-binding protein